MDENELFALAAELRDAAVTVFGPKNTDTARITFASREKVSAYVRGTVTACGCSSGSYVFGYGETARQAVDDAIRQLAEMPPHYTDEQIAATLGLGVAP